MLMTTRVKLYVFLVTCLAIIASIFVYKEDPYFYLAYIGAGISFSILGLLSELLAYKKVGRKEAGSIAFMPFIAGILLAPSWTTVISIVIATIIVQLANRRIFIKSLFNVGQITLASAACLLTYIGLGGSSLLVNRSVNIFAYLVGAVVYVLVNTIALNGVFAVSENKNFLSVCRNMSWSTLVYDVFALPFIYVFAWFYLSFGWIGAAALTIPLLGVRELYKKNWELQQTNQELLELMVAAIEARDPYTSGHSRRVSRNSMIIATALGLRGKEIERIGVAGLLHDVGKIHEIFGPILSKPSRLTPEEHAIMETHAAKSAELVSKVSSLADLVKPVLHHHENWDGTGYPAKIAGEHIPLTSRIIMFADTIDAMTTDRPYRAALTPADVKQELIRCRGKQFDPRICDVLLTSPMFASLFDTSINSQKIRHTPAFGVSVRPVPGLSST